MAYNAGPGRVAAWQKDQGIKKLRTCPLPVTNKYIRDVLQYADDFQNLDPEWSLMSALYDAGYQVENTWKDVLTGESFDRLFTSRSLDKDVDMLR